MDANVYLDSTRTILSIAGTLDALSAPELRRTADLLLGHCQADLTVDLTSLRLIDSSGVAVIVSLFRRARERRQRLTVLGVTGQPLAIFRILGLDRLLVSYQPERAVAPLR